MAKKELEARDCSPFYEVCKQGRTIIRPATTTTGLNAQVATLLKLSEYFLETNPKALEDGEMILSLRTGYYKSSNATDEGNAATQQENQEEGSSLEQTKETLQTLWWAGRHIGIANIGDTQISIRPRYGERFLLKVVEDVYNIKNSRNESETSATFSNDWFNSILHILRRKQWIDRCAKACRYGLPRRTVKRTHQGTTVHGAFDVQRTIMPWFKKREIVTNTVEKDFDERICKIVYEANRILSRDIRKEKGKKEDSKTGNTNAEMPQSVKDTINTLNNTFKGTVFDITEADYRRINYKSIYASWKPLVDFSWDVIQNRNMSLKNSSIVSDCIFVDMAEIWEAFLRKKLGEGLKNDGWSVWTVDECKQIHTYEGSFFKTKIIPDIVLQRNVNGEKQFLVLDAKYKRMIGEKIDVDRTDFFQIHTYMQYFQHAYPQGKVLLGGLLYPVTKDEIEEEIGKSHHLFGKEGGKFDTKFIIDGIVCNDDAENFNDGMMENSIQEMIERIRKHISNFDQSSTHSIQHSRKGTP